MRVGNKKVALQIERKKEKKKTLSENGGKDRDSTPQRLEEVKCAEKKPENTNIKKIKVKMCIRDFLNK